MTDTPALALIPSITPPPTQAGASSLIVPAIVTDAGGNAPRRFVEFFTANIRNPNTRAAYGVAVQQFFAWCDRFGLTLEKIEPVHVAAYIEQHPASAPTVKQHLAALKQLFDYLVTGQVMPFNPAASVRGPRYSVKKGKTPVLSPEDARKLIDSIPTSTLTGLRDRAIIGVMVFSFARISATVGMKVKDYYPNGKRYWIRLHEKGGKFHEMPAHHNAEAYLDAYIEAAGIEEEKASPLFRSIKGRTGKATERGLSRTDALRMIYRRAKAAGLNTHICCHTFRATGITVYLMNGGKLEHAQTMANHESIRTTKLYDRTRDDITLDEIEKIHI
jgi:integrase/recombinase XerD